jgi:hypothetical protein
VAPKMVSRLTPVDKLSPIANSKMNAIAMLRRAFGLLVKFRARIGPMMSMVETKTLSPFSTRIRRRS